MRMLMSLPIVSLLAAACSAAPAPVPDPGAADPFPNTYVVRVVDGKEVVTSYYASPERLKQETDAKIAYQQGKLTGTVPPSASQGSEAIGTSAAALDSDSSCVGSDLWVYNTTGCQGPDNVTEARICFKGDGFGGWQGQNLHSYTYNTCGWTNPPNSFWYCGFQHYWNNNVQSFWPGNEDGFFVDNLSNHHNYSANTSCSGAGGYDFEQVWVTD